MLDSLIAGNRREGSNSLFLSDSTKGILDVRCERAGRNESEPGCSCVTPTVEGDPVATRGSQQYPSEAVKIDGDLHRSKRDDTF